MVRSHQTDRVDLPALGDDYPAESDDEVLAFEVLSEDQPVIDRVCRQVVRLASVEDPRVAAHATDRAGGFETALFQN